MIFPRTLRFASRDFSLVSGEGKDGLVFFWGGLLASWIPGLLDRLGDSVAFGRRGSGSVPAAGCVANFVFAPPRLFASEEHAFPPPKLQQIPRFGSDFGMPQSVLCVIEAVRSSFVDELTTVRFL